MEKEQLSTPKRITALFKKFIIFALDALFPPRCVSCKKDGAYLCGSCRAQIPEHNTVSFHGVVSLWRYDDKMVRKAVHALKYRGKATLARDLAESLSDKLLETVAEDASLQNPICVTQKYVLIPIPISKKRRKTRGYNQSELLAKEISALHPDFFILEKDVLVKIKETPSQVSVRDRSEREKNIRGAFAIGNRAEIAGKRVILIDDVTTTGATIMEARRVLLQAGAKYVLAATIAH